MTTAIENVDLRHDVVQLLVREAVRAGLDSPLREPILETVSATTDESVEMTIDESAETTTGEGEETGREGQTGVDSFGDETANGAPGTSEKRRTTTAIQGLTVFVVLFVVLYVVLRYFTDEEAD